MSKDENTDCTSQFVGVELPKHDEIRSVENAIENVPPFVLGVGIEQRLDCYAVRIDEYERQQAELCQLFELRKTHYKV